MPISGHKEATEKPQDAKQEVSASESKQATEQNQDAKKEVSASESKESNDILLALKAQWKNRRNLRVSRRLRRIRSY